MKERPILFSGPMVKAILDGRKTQTRRVVKHKYYLSGAPIRFSAYDCEKGFGFESEDEFVRCPFGKPGDRLWVRETWADVNTHDGPAICYRSDGSYQHWRDFSTVFDKDYGAGPSMNYEAYPGDYCMWWTDLLNGEPDHHWRSPIHMFRWASRITLEIVGVRVERLNDITEEDAIAEGSQIPLVQLPKSCQQATMTERDQFSRIWDSINAKKYPWSSNPWVWVVEFHKIKPTNIQV